MTVEREKVRCRRCELVQWRDRVKCRRCRGALPEPVVQILERVVEEIVITQQSAQPAASAIQAQVTELGVFPTMAEVERAMITAAYQRANCKPLEAARLLGIGKTTLYRKLKEMRPAAE